MTHYWAGGPDPRTNENEITVSATRITRVYVQICPIRSEVRKRRQCSWICSDESNVTEVRSVCVHVAGQQHNQKSFLNPSPNRHYEASVLPASVLAARRAFFAALAAAAFAFLASALATYMEIKMLAQLCENIRNKPVLLLLLL